MKNRTIYLSIILWTILVGCEGAYPTEKELNEKVRYKTVVIDSCEYLVSTYNTVTLTHKGNCKYCLIRSGKIVHPDTTEPLTLVKAIWIDNDSLRIIRLHFDGHYDTLK